MTVLLVRVTLALIYIYIYILFLFDVWQREGRTEDRQEVPFDGKNVAPRRERNYRQSTNRTTQAPPGFLDITRPSAHGEGRFALKDISKVKTFTVGRTSPKGVAMPTLKTFPGAPSSHRPAPWKPNLSPCEVWFPRKTKFWPVVGLIRRWILPTPWEHNEDPVWPHHMLLTFFVVPLQFDLGGYASGGPHPSVHVLFSTMDLYTKCNIGNP
jgi:hypothetical protein